MPIYEYQCPECKSTMEKIEPFDSLKPVCVNCQSAEMERMVSKGTTWKFKEE